MATNLQPLVDHVNYFRNESMTTGQLIQSASNLLHEFKRRLAALMDNAGIELTPTQYKVLMTIDRLAPCTAQTLSATLNRDKARVTRLLQDLLTLQVVARQPHPVDKRSQLLTLTEQGHASLAQVRALESELFDQMCAGVTAAERAKTLKVLQHLIANLQD